MKTHTPGNWYYFISSDQESLEICSSLNGKDISICTAPIDHHALDESWEAEENARLISEAPATKAKLQKAEAQRDELQEFLIKYKNGYYTDGVIGLTAAFDEKVEQLIKPYDND